MSTVSSVFQVLNVPSFWLAFTVGSSAARQPCATTIFRLQKDLSRFTSWFRIADDSQPWDVRLSMSIGARAQHLRLVSPYRHFLRLWLVSCAATSKTTPPLIALDAALHDERVTAEQIRNLLRGPGSARALARLDRASDRARSPLETLARLDLEAAGLGFEVGVEIEGVGEVDLVVEGWVVVELDGYTYHCDEYQFGLDRWRDRRLVARGFLPLRFTRKDVYAHQVVPDVLKAVECWGVSKSATKAAVSLG